MPTIDQLPAASASADSDELIVSQSGIARKVTRAQLLAGVQTSFAVGTGELLGNTSGSGVAEGIAIGGNLVLAGGTLSATASPFLVYELPTGTVPSATDLVPISQSDTDVAVPYGTFMSGLSALTTVNASHFTVTPTGSTSVLKMSDFAANTIQKSGAQMTGPLLLAADPALPLQAATMEYVGNTATAAAQAAASAAFANALPLAGGTVTGPVVVGPLTNPGPSNAAVAPLLITFSPTSDRGVGGYQGFSGQVIVANIFQNPDGTGSNFQSEGLSVQENVYSGANAATIGQVALGTHITRNPAKTAAGVIQSGVTAYPACWSIYGTAADMTGLPSSQSGPLACQEYDMQVNAIDDAGTRGGYAFNADNKTQVSAGGLPATVAQGFYSTGLNNCWVNTAYRVAGNHIQSALDARAVMDGITSNTTITANATGTLAHVANVVPYTMGSNQFGGTVSASNPITNVSIGANTYEITGYTLDGPGQISGTITLSSALQGTDGNAGTAVSRPFYAVMMRTGDRIGFDYGGNIQLFYDGTVGGVRLTTTFLATAVSTSSAAVEGPLTVTGGATVQNGISMSGGFLEPPSYTFATMPAASGAPANALIWVSDALKPGEASGAGSGVPACRNAAGTAWLRVGDYTMLAH
ncbi:hypothetical protein [Acidisphaera rubrifaciens]|uniref:Uncharacterized protein n=1 Tax=Acidisphaera rubrifaciens HS-AP3 TaxID=1231350 RepID=A0A0D6P4S6_9PROT|nr:hypothetical protein [Acidisphaera rubrifaciens]GAN76346.1 hypothetical protein Asru_0086_22 [Acidisphaera rubrifaciens HS-AP3]